MGGSSAPAPPDPKETSKAQTGTNIGTAIANTIMGNQAVTTPYGSVNYDQTGSQKWTDPYTGVEYDIPQYSATTTVAPELQAALDAGMRSKSSMANLAADRTGALGDILGRSMDTSALSDMLFKQATQRVTPIMAQREEDLRGRLAAEGAAEGSERWNREMQSFGQQQNDAYNSYDVAARGQAFNEMTGTRTQALNEILGLMGGGAVEAPNIPINQPTAFAPTDVSGIINNEYNQRAQNWQAQQNSNNQMMGGLFGLLGSVLSDCRLKKNIDQIGTYGPVPAYLFHYIWDADDAPRRAGVMAQEVQAVRPDAVHNVGGFLAVDYQKLQEAR